MPEWIETGYITIDYGWNFEDARESDFWGNKRNGSFYYLKLPLERHQERLNEVLGYIAANQYEIKACIPVTQAVCSSEVGHHRDWGYGYGASTVVGCTLMLQKKIQVTETEYKERLEQAQANETKRSVEAKLPNLRKALEKAEMSPRDVVEKKGMFGGMKYMVGPIEYGEKDKAYEIADKNRAAYEKAKRKVEEAEAKLARAEQVIGAYALKPKKDD